MKKILSFLAVAALVVSCSKTDEVQPSSYIITGHSATASTRLYTADISDLGFAKAYSFFWSDGDKIWVGSQPSDPLTESNNEGSFANFVLPRVPQSGDQVIYNMKANTLAEASTAVVPAEQDASKSLGENGAFGQAELYDYIYDNKTCYGFDLENKTNFVNFNIKALPSGATLKSIRLDAGNAIVAGSAAWSSNGGWGEVSNGSSTINLKVNKNTVSDSDYITMVILPPAGMTIPSAKITYELEYSGGVKKYYEQTLGSKTFQTGEMARVSVNLAEKTQELYELRTLTFEDADYVGSEGSTYWSDFIPTSGQYGSGHGSYTWYDEGNTELLFYPVSGEYGYFAGHAGISNYVGTDWENEGNYMYDLQAYNVTGGHSGTNFNTHFGYVDETSYGMNNNMPSFEFDDGVARVIDHMWVTNTTYVYNQLQAAGFGSTYVLSDESTFKIVAYGYDSLAEDAEPVTSTEFYLLEKGKKFVTEWTKWDLTPLGNVVKVAFNLVGSDDMVGDYGLAVPAYFAYDDVTVRF